MALTEQHGNGRKTVGLIFSRRVVRADNADNRRPFKWLIFSQRFAELLAQITLIIADLLNK
jgi:hypothetical protein